MSYDKTLWVNEEGTKLNRFVKTNESSGQVELTRSSETITQIGTVFSVNNMNM